MQENVIFQAFNGAEDKINLTKVQFIPAKMEMTSSGKAPVHTYFDQYTEEVDGGKYSQFILIIFCMQQLYFPRTIKYSSGSSPKWSKIQNPRRSFGNCL